MKLITALLFFASALASVNLSRGQTTELAQPTNTATTTVLSTTIDRAQDYAIYNSRIQVTDPDGKVSVRNSRFTLLGNGLHYRDESGEWRES